MLCSPLVFLQETSVSSKELSSMRDGEGCLLPVLRHCREEDQHLMVQLLLPQICTAEVVQHLHDVKSLSLPQEKRKRSRRSKLNSSGKMAVQLSDLQCSASPAAGEGSISQDVIVFAEEMSASGRSLNTPLRSLKGVCFGNFSESHTVKHLNGFGKSEEAQNDGEADDKSYIPGLPDSVALICLAYLPLSHHRLLASLSHRHRELVRDSSLLNVRHQYQIGEQLICIYTCGDNDWEALDVMHNRWRNLPRAVVHPNFSLSDKESLAAGPHLLWLGQEAFEFASYKYDLMSNRWERGPRMVNPRCLFGSATCGEHAFVAGGFSVDMQFNVLNTAERYDSSRGIWEPLPPMSTPRQKCSGFFMDGKFYVIGGKTSDHEQITSGEEYDPVRNEWRTIENMYPVPAATLSMEPSPPLVAVAGNELYAIESACNLLKAYEKRTNTWKVLGSVPVRTDLCNGWGLAFKALGDTLYVIGGHRQEGEGVAVFSWRPQPGTSGPEWQLVNSRVDGIGNFLYNCAVMLC